MRYALVDNSTMTAVQRVLGEIPVRNFNVIDGDILALENYIQAILLYDKLVYLDDYKDQYRKARQTFFREMMDFRPGPEAFAAVKTKAFKVTEGLVPCVRGGRFTSAEFADFFAMLRMNLLFTWDMHSSVFYLTVKILEDAGGVDLPKYNELYAMMTGELGEKWMVAPQGLGDNVQLVDSAGRHIGPDYLVSTVEGGQVDTSIGAQAKVFFASLNWLAYRTVLYTMLARDLGVDLVLHPIRNSFQTSLLQHIGSHDPSVFAPLISALNAQAHAALNKVTSLTNPLVMTNQFPMFTAWLAKTTRDPGKFIEAAYELRQQPAFVQARRQLIELEDVIGTADFLKQGNRLVESVRREMERICAEYSVGTRQGVSLSNIIGVYNLFALVKGLPQLPELDAEIKQLGFLQNISKAKGMGAMYRTVIHDLTQIARLGEYHSIITSKVVEDEKVDYYGLKTEDPAYLGKRSWWKLPM